MKMFWPGVMLWLIAMLSSCLAADLAPGLHENLPCDQAKSCTCTVYLPPAYAETTQRLPVLFLSSPSGKPAVPVWQAWADAHAVILVGINDTRNGMEMKEIKRIQDAVLDTVTSQLRVHPFLRFSTGASGGAMVSLFLAQRQEDRWGGVLMQIHGGSGLKPDPKVPVAFLVGEQDTIYPFPAVQRDCLALREAGNPVRIESYPGLGHGGIPQADAERMLDWLLDYARLAHPRLSDAERRRAREHIKERLLAAPAMADPAAKREECERLVLLPKLTAFRETDVRPVLDAWYADRLARIDALADLRCRHFYLRDLEAHPATRLLTEKQRQAIQTRLDECRSQAPVKQDWEAEQEFARLPDTQHVTPSGVRRVATAYLGFAERYPGTYEGDCAARIGQAFQAIADQDKPRAPRPVPRWHLNP